MKPTFEKMCEFVTIDVFEFSQIDKYSKQEQEQLKNVADIVLEEHWLPQIFGTEAQLSGKQFVEKVCPKKEGRKYFKSESQEDL